MAEIERPIGDYYVFEVDGKLAGCIALHLSPRAKKAEMACVCVAAKYENQGIGGRLMQYVLEQARGRSVRDVLSVDASGQLFLEERQLPARVA